MTGIDISISCGRALLTVAGELDLASYEEVATAVVALVAAGQGPVTLDMSGVEFIDSGGLRALVLAQRATGGGLVIIDPSPPVRRLLQLTQLDEVFTVADANPTAVG